MKLKLIPLFLFCYLWFTCSTTAQDTSLEQITESVNTFVTAFNNFDWPTFKDSFTDDASIFYPFWNQVARVKGKENLEKVWLKIFPEFADESNTSMLKIAPKDVNIQVYENSAIVTFHLGNGVNALARRTLVMVNDNHKWKIAHLHASNLKEE